MKFLLTKTCQGVFDTATERKRIKEAFKKDPETREKLNELMDAIEAMDWKKAGRLLEGKWWNGRDKRLECHRGEFIGGLKLMDPKDQRNFAYGFDFSSQYSDLVLMMLTRGDQYKVERVDDK